LSGWSYRLGWDYPSVSSRLFPPKALFFAACGSIAIDLRFSLAIPGVRIMAASSIVLLLSLVTVGMEDSVNGVVVGPGGRPVAGAEVFALNGDRAGLPGFLIGRTRTDKDGRFSVRLTEHPSSCDQPTLWAVADDLVVASCLIDHRMSEVEPIRLRLGSAGGASFVVAGPDGRAIPGAKVIPRTVAREPNNRDDRPRRPGRP
jgi:hypothetical protein